MVLPLKILPDPHIAEEPRGRGRHGFRGRDRVHALARLRLVDEQGVVKRGEHQGGCRSRRSRADDDDLGGEIGRCLRACYQSVITDGETAAGGALL